MKNYRAADLVFKIVRRLVVQMTFYKTSVEVTRMHAMYTSMMSRVTSMDGSHEWTSNELQVFGAQLKDF